MFPATLMTLFLIGNNLLLPLPAETSDNSLLPVQVRSTDNMLVSLDLTKPSGLPGGVLRTPLPSSEPAPMESYNTGILRGACAPGEACQAPTQAPMKGACQAPGGYSYQQSYAGQGGGGRRFLGKLLPRNWGRNR